MIPSVARSYFVKKVVVVGTESCGKSTLVRNLASVFNTNYVAEYGRTRCEEIGGYDGVLLDEDYPMIAYEQQRQVEKASAFSNRVLFVDTEATVTQFYSELYNGKLQRYWIPSQKPRNMICICSLSLTSSGWMTAGGCTGKKQSGGRITSGYRSCWKRTALRSPRSRGRTGRSGRKRFGL